MAALHREAIMRVLSFLLLLLLGTAAQAQPYPSRPITLLVPAAAGGGNDTVARVIADKIARILGQPIVVENHPGAGGGLAARTVARSDPDGYTIGIGNPATLAIAPAMFPNVGYDPTKDFAPVGMIAASPHIILVNKDNPAHTLAALIAMAKQEPGKLTFGSGGAGSPTHLGPELFASMAGIKITHVPYKGTGPAISDLLGNHITMTFSSLPPAIGLVRDGKVRPIAVTGAKRSKILPDVPTVSETVPGYESAQRYGIIAPAHTPPEIVGKLNAALREALTAPQTRTQLANYGADVAIDTPEEFGKMLAKELALWTGVAKAAHLQME